MISHSKNNLSKDDLDTNQSLSEKKLWNCLSLALSGHPSLPSTSGVGPSYHLDSRERWAQKCRIQDVYAKQISKKTKY